MPKVGILMGSDSDLPIMKIAADTLEELGVEYEMTIISAHRMPDIFTEYTTKAQERGIKVLIAGAGGGTVFGTTSGAGGVCGSCLRVKVTSNSSLISGSGMDV